MTWFRVICTVIAPIMVLVSCNRPPAPASDAAKPGSGVVLTDLDRAAILRVDSTLEYAVNTGSLDSVAAIYAEDASLMPPGEPAVTGRESIRQYWGRVMDRYNLRYERGMDELEGRGDLAYQRGRFQLTASPKAKGAAAVSDRGKFIVVYRRGASGAWSVVIDMYNSDLPAARTP
jgi:ketosteroid isomerase-like protein